MQKTPLQNSEVAQSVLEQTEMIFKKSARTPCKLTSNSKRNMTRKPTPQNSKEENMCVSFSSKQNIEQVKFPLRNFGGLGLIFLKKSAQ